MEIIKYNHICGYSCSIRGKESGKIPSRLWPHIINKEDFEEYRKLYPNITKKKLTFEYLTIDEIREMSDIQREDYFIQKEKQDSLDPFLSDIHNELNKEDERVYQIETDEINYESSNYDDY